MEAEGTPPLSTALTMIQALPLIESGAADAAGLTDRHLALACASHSGARMHVDGVGAWLSGLDLDESGLLCGCHMPRDRDENRRLTCSDETPSPRATSRGKPT